MPGPGPHNHICTRCGDEWPCENDLCDAGEDCDDLCDDCIEETQ
jgi:hypothetical protein